MSPSAYGLSALVAGIVGILGVATFFSVAQRVNGLVLGLTGAMWSAELFGLFEQPHKLVWVASLVVAILFLVLGFIATKNDPNREQQRAGRALALTWSAYIVIGSGALLHIYPFQRGVLVFGAGLLAYFGAQRLDAENRARVLRQVAYAGVFQTLLSVAQLAMGMAPIWGYRNGVVMNPLLGNALERAQGTLGHPNTLAYVLALSLMAAVSAEVQLPKRRRILVVVVLLVGVVLTGARLIIPCIVVAWGAYLLLRSRYGAHFHRFLAFVAVVAVIGSQFAGEVSTVANNLLRSGSWDQRLSSVRAVPKLLNRSGADYWFGNGYGNVQGLYDHGYIVSPYGVPLIDNWFVFMLGTIGVVGLSLYLVWWLVILRKSDPVGVSMMMVITVLSFGFDIGRLLSPAVLMFMVFGLAFRRDEVSAVETTTELSVSRVSPTVGESPDRTKPRVMPTPSRS